MTSTSEQNLPDRVREVERAVSDDLVGNGVKSQPVFRQSRRGKNPALGAPQRDGRAGDNT